MLFLKDPPNVQIWCIYNCCLTDESCTLCSYTSISYNKRLLKRLQHFQVMLNQWCKACYMTEMSKKHYNYIISNTCMHVQGSQHKTCCIGPVLSSLGFPSSLVGPASQVSIYSNQVLHHVTSISPLWALSHTIGHVFLILYIDSHNEGHADVPFVLVGRAPPKLSRY